jgi:hypothetical protein
MKTYYSKESIQHLYLVVGVGFSCLLIYLLISKNSIQMPAATHFMVCVLVAMMAAMHLVRPKTCRLEINDEELYFNDGLLNRTTIPLDLIKSIDYHPDLKFRFTLKKHHRQVKMTNVFSEEDQKEILALIRKKRHNITVNYLERPEHIITRTESKDTNCE